jgi:hypothetical protein
MWDFWRTTLHWSRFSRSTWVSPANPSADCSTSIIRGWYNRSVVADVPSGLSLTPPSPPQQTELRTPCRLPAAALTAGYEVSHNDVRYSWVAHLPMTHQATWEGRTLIDPDVITVLQSEPPKRFFVARHWQVECLLKWVTTWPSRLPNGSRVT